MSKATPQNVDFTPHNGNYCVTLLATQPIHTWGWQKRNFKIKGRLEEGKTISADLIVENEMLLVWQTCRMWHTRATVPYLQDYPCFHLLRLWSLTAYGTASGYAENSLHGLPFQKSG